MDLKEYIKSAITQISEAVSELNEELPDTVVNPTLTKFSGNHTMVSAKEKADSYHVTEITFRIATNISEGSESKLKVGVAAAVLGIGAGGGADERMSDDSSISFTLNVVLPSKGVGFGK